MMFNVLVPSVLGLFLTAASLALFVLAPTQLTGHAGDQVFLTFYVLEFMASFAVGVALLTLALRNQQGQQQAVRFEAELVAARPQPQPLALTEAGVITAFFDTNAQVLLADGSGSAVAYGHLPLGARIGDVVEVPTHSPAYCAGWAQDGTAQLRYQTLSALAAGGTNLDF